MLIFHDTKYFINYFLFFSKTIFYCLTNWFEFNLTKLTIHLKKKKLTKYCVLYYHGIYNNVRFVCSQYTWISNSDKLTAFHSCVILQFSHANHANSSTLGWISSIFCNTDGLRFFIHPAVFIPLLMLNTHVLENHPLFYQWHVAMWKWPSL